MPYSALQQAHAMLLPPSYNVLAPCAALDPICLGSTHSASRPVVEPPPTLAHLPTAWQKISSRK